MGMTSARRAAQILVNSERVIAIEFLAAAQGLELRAPLDPAPGTGAALKVLRTASSYLDEDRSLARDIEAACELVASDVFEEAVAEAIGGLS